MDQVEEIKQKLDIVDVIGGYVSLKKSGRNYKGICPFHSEKSPSFMVSQELQIFKCFGCNEAGDIFKFVGKVEGVDFPQALELLAEKAGITLNKRAPQAQDRNKKILFEINHLTTALYQFLLLKHPSGQEALKYVKETRKLTDETIKDFQIGYAPDALDVLYKALLKKNYTEQQMLDAGVIVRKQFGEGYMDKYRGRLMFPLTDVSGKIVGFTGRTVINKDPKYLNTPETEIFHKSSFLYALDKAKIDIKKSGAIVVEGQMDTVTARQFGFGNVVASGGTSLTIPQLKTLARYTKDLILCFDADTAGTSAILRGIELAEQEGFNLMVIAVPAPYKDLDEILNTDLNLAKEVISNPVPIYDFFLAAAFKKNDKNTALGKKKIMEDLVEKFSKVSNKVILDHYIKKIAENLNLEPSTVESLITTKNAQIPQNEPQTSDQELAKFAKKSAQEYILALLLKAPLDTAQTILYKLGLKDFTNPELQEVFTALKEHLIGRKRKFEIQSFSNKLEENSRKIVQDLYLWDLEELVENEKRFGIELDTAFDRLKKEAAKRELKELTEKMKEAELAKDSKLIKELTERAKTLSGKLA